jgi:hypothetical protein
MEFRNRLKGKLIQALMESLLTDVGYKVIPLGIEEVVREVKGLDKVTYLNLKLSPNLRCLPDFLIADKTMQEQRLVEVKYRKKWNLKTKQSLHRSLLEQTKVWQPLYLVVFLGNPSTPEDPNPSGRIGIGKLVFRDDTLLMACRYLTDEEDSLYSGKYGRIKLEDQSPLSLGYSWYEYQIPWIDIEWKHFKRLQDEFQDLRQGWMQSTLHQSAFIVESIEKLDNEAWNSEPF